MDHRMERISEVTEPDNSDILSEKNQDFRRIEAKVSKKTELPELPEIVKKPVVHKSSTQAQRFYGTKTKTEVRKTRSVPDVLSGTPLSKLNVSGTGASSEEANHTKIKETTSKNDKIKTYPTKKEIHSRTQQQATDDSQKQVSNEMGDKQQKLNSGKNNLSSTNFRKTRVKSRSLDDVRGETVKNDVQRTNTDSAFNSPRPSFLKQFQNEVNYYKQRTEKASKAAYGSSTTLSSQAPTDASDDPEQDHINVVLRVRPLNSLETGRKDKFSCTFPGSGKIEVDNNGSLRQFGYNVVFEPDATQADLFDHSGVKKLIDMALNGYACTALAFGQTGSGKTHTMTGPPQQFQEGKQVDPEMYGIIQRSLKYLFQQLQQQHGTKIVRASYLEIYNEQVIDLLNPNMRRYLQVRWSKNKGFYVENLFVVECETEDDLNAVLEEGMRNRQTGSHGLNEFSSRSHSMLMLTIDSEMQDPDDENLFITKRGKLTFVDLAGSEKVKDSNSTGDSLVESNSINKSLLVLGNCISSLGDQKRRQGHIPYRDSKLTKLLADSLGGNGVTLMICCITPSSYHASETMNTLRYASRAKKIRTKPVIKMDPREKLILSLKREIKVLRNENHYLRQQLEFPAKPRGQLQKENDQKFMKIMKETNEKIKQNGGSAEESGLYEMLQEYMVENEALRTENAEMQVNRDKVRQDQQVLYRDNEKLMRRVDELERRLNQAQANWQTMPRQEGRSRDHSPRGSPQYRGGGSGGRMVQAKFAQPPNDLPLRDNPALWDPIYPGSPPQGYPSPTTNGRAKQPAGPGQPSSGTRGQPMKPPHRLSDTIPPQRPVHEQNGPPYMNGHPPGPMQQPGSSGQYRQAHIGSPNRSNDAIRDMNEKLKQELMQLDGQIHHHQVINQHRTGNSYGSQGSMR